MTHTKVLVAVAEFLDKHCYSHYLVEGYFGFAYLTIPTIEGGLKYKFDLIDDEVVVTNLKN
jgi:hypothetical protein